jgi:hypothetical protein
MRRRRLLHVVAGSVLTALAGCVGYLTDCPDDLFGDMEIPADRRSIQFFSDENRPSGVAPGDPPTVHVDTNRSEVHIRGIFSGATPKSRFPKDMIVVDRLSYDGQTDTLEARLTERECKSSGAAVGGETTPYELRVTFPDGLPKTVCAQEGGSLLASDEDVRRRCVSSQS